MQRRRDTLPPFEQVVERHGPAVLRFCVGRVGAGRGEDAFQETMLSALRGYGDVREPEAIRSWLFSIAARKVIDAHRAAARTPEPVVEIEPATSVRDAPLVDDEVWTQVRALPEKQRQAVTLRYLADLSHREIAGVMQTSEPAARRSVFEGLRRLREESQAR